MNFYLVRHGEATPEGQDPRRPLTAHGRSEVEKVAGAAAAEGITVSEIFHSGKLRAKETAEILARHLSPPRGVRETKGLAPLDDPLVIRCEFETAKEDLMVVGHLPHLSRLASLLLTSNPDREVVPFPPAALVCLSFDQRRWELKWSLTPQSE